MDPALTSDYFTTGEEDAVFATVCRPPPSSKTSRRNMSHGAKSDSGSTKYKPTFISYKSDLEGGNADSSETRLVGQTKENDGINFTLQRQHNHNEIEDSNNTWSRQQSTQKIGQNY